jgi:two-component system sensor kinase FixL
LMQRERKLAAQAAAADIEHKRAAELEKAYKELESVNKELNDFAYIVSHDLKAPLRGISTLVNWILTDYADKFDEEGKEQMDLLLSRVERMHNLIDGILQYSRVGRIKEEKTQVSLNELVPDIIDILAPPENIAITIENELPVIECEKTRITQVFQNLLSNAIKYMDKPQGHVRIGCVEEESCWRFSITDNGPGIEDKYFEKIFQMFQTLSTRDENPSSGIGLSTVKKIVEMYGGKVWVESKPGQGSTFLFTLPKQKTAVEHAEQPVLLA